MVYTPFKGVTGGGDDTALLAPDGDHPSQDVYLKRFSSLAPTLRDGLSKVEAELDSWRQKTMVRDGSDVGSCAADIIDTIKSQPSISLLTEWLGEAAVLSLDDFRAYLRR